MKWKYIKASIIGIIFIVIYMIWIERHLLKVNEVIIHSAYIDEDLKGLRIIQFSDTQLGDFYTIEDLERAVEKMNTLDADIVVFTGDLIDHVKYYEGDFKDIVIILDSIEATYGKYAVYGNHDQGGGGHHVYSIIMKESGFELLVNETEIIEIGSSKLSITGIDDWLLGYPELHDTLQPLEQEQFNIVLLHEPDVVDLTCNYPVDLQLSGHSHGGQVRLPFIEPFIIPHGAKKYTQGLYQIDERCKLYVNTGLGNTLVPFRFFNIPEITVLQCE